MIGTVLKHRYEVLEKIGEGNLFTVYKAEDKIDNRVVAVKVLLPQYAAIKVFAERMIMEAQAMVGLVHPGIVQVHDTGSDGEGNYFIVIEYVHGVDLKERIRRNAPFTLSTVVDLGLALCDALDYAHRKGFVHGDLRPGNVLITTDGHVKVADFWASEAVASSQSIRTSAMMRSVHYMSPEVAEGNPATPVSDVYSLGIILFETLTGAVPYDADSPIAIALKHAKEAVPSIRAKNPAVPKSLEMLISKALQKVPEQRFRSAKAMLNELKSVRDALHLAKPLVWSSVNHEAATEPILDEEEGPEREPAVLSVLLKVLAVIVGMVAVLAAVAMGYVFMNPGEVEVPDLVGMDLQTATAVAKQRNIRLVVKAEEYNDKFPEGQIYFTNPKAGLRIKEGKFVDVWLSKGSRYVMSPSLVGLPEEDARQRLTDAHLVVGEISQDYSETIPAGSVIAQSPQPGVRMERGQPVNMVTSLGPKPQEETYTPSDTGDETAQEPRQFDVNVEVPRGRQNQRVQIVVVDDFGESTVYDEVRHPGDNIMQTVQGTGKQITIRVYIDDRLVREEKK